VTENQSAHPSIPLLKGNEEQTGEDQTAARRDVSESLRLVQDVHHVWRWWSASPSALILTMKVEHVPASLRPPIGLFVVLKTLTEIVERFGGKTEMSEAASRKEHVMSSRKAKQGQRRNAPRRGRLKHRPEHRRHRVRQGRLVATMRAGALVIRGKPMHRHRVNTQCSCKTAS